MKTLVELPADTQTPADLLDFHAWGREPMGEYFYYFAADPALVVDGKVNSTISKGAVLEVSVSFESDALDVANRMITRVATGADGAVDEQRVFLKRMLDRDLASWAEFNQKTILGALSSRDNCCSWFNYSHYGSPDLSFHFIKVDNDRVISIVAYTNCTTVIPRELYSRWEQLKTSYRNIPYSRFQGASRM